MNNNKGFSLLEVLVAFAILSMALGVLLNIFSLGIRTTRVATSYQQALMLAESKLTELEAAPTLMQGQTRGRFDDQYWWQSTIESVDIDEFRERDLSISVYQLRVTVGWEGYPDGITLSSLQLARTSTP